MNWSSRNIFLKCFMKRFWWPQKLIPVKQPGLYLHNHISNGANKLFVENFGGETFDGPTLHDFMSVDVSHGNNTRNPQVPDIPYLQHQEFQKSGQKVFFDVHGCQMNVSDTEVVWSILKSAGFIKTEVLNDADVILIMTCAIREGAENKIWNKLLYNLQSLKKNRLKQTNKPAVKIGILGCMAERLKKDLLEKEKSVDLVAGPDSYRDLPRLLAQTYNDQTAINVLLSIDETYADVMPVRLNEGSKSAFVSIMRGCDNMCTYCIVPFTRGRERSRPIQSIVTEIQHLVAQGVKEVVLLGQNVNSYQDLSVQKCFVSSQRAETVKGFKTVYKPKKRGLNFADLLDSVSSIDPNLRIRFTSPHPKDFPDEVLEVISERRNICRSLHIPAQSGNTNVLERMRRGYSREAYIDLIEQVRYILPDVTISSDFICGFCGETDEEFADTLSLLKEVKYNSAYIFPYSMREKTTAHRRFKDDVAQEVKQQRVDILVSQFRSDAEKLNEAQIGSIQLVLVEGESKRSTEHSAGRSDGNTKVIIPNISVAVEDELMGPLEPYTTGDYLAVKITGSSSQVLKGTPLYKTNLVNFYQKRDKDKCLYSSC